jgi:hypothetical protein
MFFKISSSELNSLASDRQLLTRIKGLLHAADSDYHSQMSLLLPLLSELASRASLLQVPRSFVLLLLPRVESTFFLLLLNIKKDFACHSAAAEFRWRLFWPNARGFAKSGAGTDVVHEHARPPGTYRFFAFFFFL